MLLMHKWALQTADSQNSRAASPFGLWVGEPLVRGERFPNLVRANLLRNCLDSLANLGSRTFARCFANKVRELSANFLANTHPWLRESLKKQGNFRSSSSHSTHAVCRKDPPRWRLRKISPPHIEDTEDNRPNPSRLLLSTQIRNATTWAPFHEGWRLEVGPFCSFCFDHQYDSYCTSSRRTSHSWWIRRRDFTMQHAWFPLFPGLRSMEFCSRILVRICWASYAAQSSQNVES